MQTDLTQLRPGNIIVVYPRENQDGILSILEIQETSVLCEMLIPRKGYLFRIKFDEINSLKLDKGWLEKASFINDNAQPDVWFCNIKKTRFYFSGTSGTFIENAEKNINFVHELQNGYFELTGTDLKITIQ